jgi:hypothetical protein
MARRSLPLKFITHHITPPSSNKKTYNHGIDEDTVEGEKEGQAFHENAKEAWKAVSLSFTLT